MLFEPNIPAIISSHPLINKPVTSTARLLSVVTLKDLSQVELYIDDKKFYGVVISCPIGRNVIFPILNTQ